MSRFSTLAHLNDSPIHGLTDISTAFFEVRGSTETTSIVPTSNPKMETTSIFEDSALEAANAGDNTSSMDAVSHLNLTIKHGKASYELAVATTSSIADLKERLEVLTEVPQGMQKLMFKGVLQDSCIVCESKLKDGCKVMMLGNKQSVVEKAIERPPDSEIGEVFDDFDLDFVPTMEDLERNSANQGKLAASIAKTHVQIVNEPREGKKLLVLDLDHCLLHFSSSSSSQVTPEQMKRPFMDEFLSECYVHYDLVIWSQTSWRWVEIKLTELGMLTHPQYKICFVLDKSAMFKISVRNPKPTRKHPEEYRDLSVKPLQLVWSKYARWSAANTVQVDDLQRNFSMNMQSGLRCRAYDRKVKGASADRELLEMAKYLLMIAAEETDFTTLDHNKWEDYVRKRAT
jgi:ubiquitin-like domain-containing CTD phosphatase 1